MNTADREAGSDYSRGDSPSPEPRRPVFARHAAASQADSHGPRGAPSGSPRPGLEAGRGPAALGGPPGRPEAPLARLGRHLGRVPRRGPELAAIARRLLLAGGLGGAVLLVAADFATLYTVSAIGVTRLTVAGHDQHRYALVVVGAVAVLMLVAAAGEARPPLFAVALLGVIALVIGPISDAGVVGSPGVIGEIYDSATAHAGAGYHLELVGAVLLLVASAGLLLLSAPARSPRPGAGTDPPAVARASADGRGERPPRAAPRSGGRG